MAMNTDLMSASVSMKLAGDGDKTISSVIPGLVKNPDNAALFAVAKLINDCQAYSMTAVDITQRTRLTEA